MAQSTPAPASSGHLPAATVSLPAGVTVAADARVLQCGALAALGGALAAAAACPPAGAAAAADPGWRVPQSTPVPASLEFQPAATGNAALLPLPLRPYAAVLREAAGIMPASGPAGLLSPRVALAQKTLSDMAEGEQRLAHEQMLRTHREEQVGQYLRQFLLQHEQQKQQDDERIRGLEATSQASRAALIAAYQSTQAQGVRQLGCAGVGHVGGAGMAAATMQPAGSAAGSLNRSVQGRGQLGRAHVGVRPTGGAGMAAAWLQPAGEAGVALDGRSRASGGAATVRSAIMLQSGEARRRLDLARFPLGVPSAAEMEYAKQMSTAVGADSGGRAAVHHAEGL